MMRGRWVYPLDPDCPEVAKFEEGADDPFMAMSGCYGEFYEAFARRHRIKCERCQMYGCENVDVAY